MLDNGHNRAYFVGNRDLFCRVATEIKKARSSSLNVLYKDIDRSLQQTFQEKEDVMEVLITMALLIAGPIILGYLISNIEIPNEGECDICGGPVKKKYLRMVLRNGIPQKVLCLICLKRMPQEMKSELQMLEAA